jgi:hypothetical protein
MAITKERKNILRRYIKSSVDKGTPIPEIKDKLKGFGYSNGDVDGLVSEVIDKKTLQKSSKEEKKEPIAPALTRSPDVSFGFNYKKLALAVGGVAAFIILVFAGFFLLAGPENCGGDKDCFITNAQSCNPSILELDDGGTITTYEVNEACVMVRTMTKLAESEPQEVKLLFENRSMVCTYSRGQFDVNLVNTITRGLENCDGSLKDSIYELIIAQYERSLAAI